MTNQIMERSKIWEEAERNNDSSALVDLLHDKFNAVGPVGFVLDRSQWLVRYDNGLHNDRFDWHDVQQRDFGDNVAVLIGTQTQATTYQGRANNGDFRVTQVWLKDEGSEWLLASLQLSPIFQPPAA